MNLIKVIHLITKLELGGAQVNTINTFKNLDPNQFETYLLSGRGGILDYQVEASSKYLPLKNLVRNINPIVDFKCLIELIKSIKKIKPQIIHTHSSKAGILGRIAAWLCRVPVIVHTVHGYAFSPRQSFLRRSVYIAIEWFVSKISSCYIFVSHSDLNTARQKKFKLQNSQIIRSGFPFDDFLKTHNKHLEYKKKYSIDKDNIVIGIIAPFKKQKGLHHLVKIAELVLKQKKNVVFFIAGDGDLRTEIENSLKNLGILEHFRLPGFIFDIAKVIDIFDIGLSTALWEGLPQSLVQLRLKQKPLVVSNIPGNNEVVKHAKNGFLADLNNYPQFADHLIKLIDNPDLRLTLGKYSEEDFSEWDSKTMVKAQENLYLKLIDIYLEKNHEI